MGTVANVYNVIVILIKSRKCVVQLGVHTLVFKKRYFVLVLKA